MTIPAQAGPRSSASTSPSSRTTTTSSSSPGKGNSTSTISVSDPVTAFWVTVDGLVLPSFTECSGLSAEYEAVPWTEAGNNAYVHQLPGRVTYSPITLVRAVDSASAALAAWFTSVAQRTTTFRTASIQACDLQGNVKFHWDLVQVWPRRWSGPTFTATGTTPAAETVELVHHGFTFVAGSAT